jgi:hypothetical protein
MVDTNITIVCCTCATLRMPTTVVPTHVASSPVHIHVTTSSTPAAAGSTSHTRPRSLRRRRTRRRRHMHRHHHHVDIDDQKQSTSPHDKCDKKGDKDRAVSHEHIYSPDINNNKNNSDHRLLPSVIGSLIYSYLPLTDGFISLSHVNHYWCHISTLPLSRHPLWGTYDLTHLRDTTTENVIMWLKRLLSYDIVSLALPRRLRLDLPTHTTTTSNDGHAHGTGTNNLGHVILSMASTLRSLSVGCINSDLITHLSRLTSLSIGEIFGDGPMYSIALPSLRHYSVGRHELPPPRWSSIDIIDWLLSSLTSFSDRVPTCMSPSELQQLLSHVSLCHLDLIVHNSNDALEAVFTCPSLTSLVIHRNDDRRNATWESWSWSWIPLAAASLSSLYSTSSLQRIEFIASETPSIDVLRGIAIAAPNIIRIDNISISLLHDKLDERARDEFITVMKSFKHLRYLNLHLRLDQLCESTCDLFLPPTPTSISTKLDVHGHYRNALKKNSTTFTIISPSWLSLVPIIKQLHVSLPIRLFGDDDDVHIACSTLSIAMFIPLTYLERLVITQVNHTNAGNENSQSAIIKGSFDYIGLRHLTCVELVTPVLIGLDWLGDMSPKFNPVRRVPTYLWQSFIKSLSNNDNGNGTHLQRLRIYFNDLVLIQSWLALLPLLATSSLSSSSSSLIASQFICEPPSYQWNGANDDDDEALEREHNITSMIDNGVVIRGIRPYGV